MSLIGKTLPAFSLLDDQGTIVTNADFKGHWIVLYAYPKDSTPGCTTEACDFRDRNAALKKLGAKIYGISRDAMKSHQNFIAKQNLTFPLLSDPDTALLKPLGAFGKKIMYGKEVLGIIRSTFLVDPEGVIRHVWPKVRVKDHAEEVLAVLKELKK
ncbi:MAG TPA: peroxiredoxin [Holophagaceae bacterium]|nr:peroxiredoxin [Holophagaceae bacterium]